MSEITLGSEPSTAVPTSPDDGSNETHKTPGGSHTAKKRNRPSLVCFPCRKKKIKCDKGKPCLMCVKNNIVEHCEYDQRLLAKKEGKGKKPKSEARAAKRRKTPALDVSIETTEPPLESAYREKEPKSNEASLPVSSNDVCVIMKKSDLEELQSKLKQYESMITLPVSSRKKLGMVTPKHKKDDNIVYNRSISSYRGVIFTKHEETRPGYVPLTDVLSDQNDVYDLEESVTNEIRLDQVCKREQYLAGINPYNDPNDVIPLYSQVYSSNDGSKTRSLYPLSWSYSVRNSASLKALKAFAAKQKDKNRLSGINVGITYDPIKRLMEPVDERIKSTLNYDESSVSRFEAKTKDSEDDKLIRKRSKSTSLTSIPVNMSTLALELSVLGGPRDHEMTLIEQIQAVIPTKRVIWLHINRFMYLLYPFFPYVIEDDFRNSIAKIVGKESYEETKPEVQILHRVDFAEIGILFIMLRLSYLSLFHNRGFHNERLLAKTDLTPEEAEKKFLLMNQIEIGAAEIAQACFRHLERMGRVSIGMLQCGVFLRLYRIYAPEEGDGLEGGYGQIQNSCLVSMSYMLGLNREPDKTPDFKDDKVKNLYRKIWYFVILSEYNSAILFGSPVLVKKESYDTKKPFFTWKNSNLRHKETDQTSIFAFMSTMIGGPIQRVISLYSNVQGNVKVMELATHLNTIEVGMRKLLGKLEDYLYTLEELDTRYHTNKISKVSSLLKVYSFLMLNYCFLFNYYEKVNNPLSYYYLKKMLTLAMGEVLVSGFALITKSQEIFGEGADLFINPIIIQVLTRISDICIIGIVRSNFSLYKARADMKKGAQLTAEHKKFTASLNRFITLMEKSCRICLIGISILSKRYFFAWEVVRTQNYYLKLVTSSAFYKEINIDGLDFAQPTAERMVEVVDYVEASLEKLGKIVDKYCQEVGIDSAFKRTDAEYQNDPKEQSPYESRAPFPAETNTRSQEHVSQSLDTPTSVDSTGLYFSGFEDLRFDNSEQIDSIWLQMLSLKTSNQNTGILLYNTLLQEQPSLLNNTGIDDFGRDNVSYNNIGAPQIQYSNPCYASPQVPQPDTGIRTNSVSSNVQGQAYTTDMPDATGQLQQPQVSGSNLFNYSEMFDDLPLDKLFNR